MTINFTAIWAKARVILGALTDALLIGRARGWWERKQGPGDFK